MIQYALENQENPPVVFRLAVFLGPLPGPGLAFGRRGRPADDPVRGWAARRQFQRGGQRHPGFLEGQGHRDLCGPGGAVRRLHREPERHGRRNPAPERGSCRGCLERGQGAAGRGRNPVPKRAGRGVVVRLTRAAGGPKRGRHPRRPGPGRQARGGGQPGVRRAGQLRAFLQAPGHLEKGQGQDPGLQRCVHRIYPAETGCVLAVHRVSVRFGDHGGPGPKHRPAESARGRRGYAGSTRPTPS